MSASGAAFNRGDSRQDWCTPPEFIEAVERRFGDLECDLACERATAVAPYGYRAEADDALARDWFADFGFTLCWLNPPYANIKPWAAKCAQHAERGGRVLFLVPASLGTAWFRDHVYGRAQVLVVGRLTFGSWIDVDGARTWDPVRSPTTGKPTGFPKDLMLCCYGTHEPPFGIELWDWKKGVSA